MHFSRRQTFLHSAMAKAAFNKKKNRFTSKLDLNLRKKLVKCYVWSMAVYGAETWTLWATDQKRQHKTCSVICMLYLPLSEFIFSLVMVDIKTKAP